MEEEEETSEEEESSSSKDEYCPADGDSEARPLRTKKRRRVESEGGGMVDVAREESQGLQSETVELKKKVSHLTGRIEAQQLELKSAKDGLKTVKLEVVEQKKGTSWLKKEAKKKDSKLKELGKEKKKSEREKEDVRGELNQLKNALEQYLLDFAAFRAEVKSQDESKSSSSLLSLQLQSA